MLPAYVGIDLELTTHIKTIILWVKNPIFLEMAFPPHDIVYATITAGGVCMHGCFKCVSVSPVVSDQGPV